MTYSQPQKVEPSTLPDHVDQYLLLLSRTIDSISREKIWEAVRVLFSAWKNGKRVYLFGNGGSAATASHMANDLNKYLSIDGKPRMKAIALTDNVPVLTAWANDTQYENIFAEQLKNFLDNGDVVIAISASGNSPNVVKAIEVAHAKGATTIGFTGIEGGQVKCMVQHCILIPDEYIMRQEDGHMILDHVIVTALRQLIEMDSN
jgi:D-sedoheptulose 7-phosphate isomerase